MRRMRERESKERTTALMTALRAEDGPPLSWMYNCVGHNNYRYFFNFLAWLWLGCLVTVAGASRTVLQHGLTGLSPQADWDAANGSGRSWRRRRRGDEGTVFAAVPWRSRF